MHFINLVVMQFRPTLPRSQLDDPIVLYSRQQPGKSGLLNRLGLLAESTKLRRGYLPVSLVGLDDLFSASLETINIPFTSIGIFKSHARAVTSILSNAFATYRILEKIGMAIARGLAVPRWPFFKSKLERLHQNIMESARNAGAVSSSQTTTAQILFASAQSFWGKAMRCLLSSIRKKCLYTFGQVVDFIHGYFDALNNIVALVADAQKDLIKIIPALSPGHFVKIIKSSAATCLEYTNAKGKFTRSCIEQVNALLARSVSIDRDTDIALVEAQIRNARLVQLVTSISQIYAVSGDHQTNLKDLFLKKNGFPPNIFATLRKCADLSAALKLKSNAADEIYFKRHGFIVASNAWSSKPNVAAATSAMECTHHLEDANHEIQQFFQKQQMYWGKIISHLEEVSKKRK